MSNKLKRELNGTIWGNTLLGVVHGSEVFLFIFSSDRNIGISLISNVLLLVYYIDNG